MKRFLLSLLCLLAVTSALMAETHTLTMTPQKFGNSFTSSNKYAKFESDEFKDDSNNISGIKCTTYAYRFYTKSNSYYAFQMKQNSYYAISTNSNDYLIKTIKIIALDSKGKALESTTNQEIWKYNSDSDVTLGNSSISAKNENNITKSDYDLYTAPELEVNSNFCSLVITSNATYRVEQIIITYEEANKEPQELNLTFNPAEITVNENVENAAIPSYSPAVDLTYTVKCLDTDGDNQGLEINADNKTMTAYYPGRYEVTGSYVGGEDYLAGSGSFIVNVVVPKKELSFDFNTKQFNVNINEATPFSFTALDEEDNEIAANALKLSYAIEPAEGLTIEGNSFTATAAGTYTVTATATYTDDYDPAEATFTVTAVDPNAKFTDIIETNFFTTGYGNAYKELSKTSSSTGISYKAMMAPSSKDEFRLKESVIENNTYKNYHSGIIVTENPNGYIVKEVKVYWSSNSGNAATYQIDVYYNEDDCAFEHINNLWGKQSDNKTDWTTSKEATIGEGAVCGTIKVANVEIANPNKKYIGIRPKSNANYLSKIEIVWGYPEAKLSWADEDGNVIDNTEIPFNFSIDNNGAVNAHTGTYHLVSNDKTFDLSNIEIKEIANDGQSTIAGEIFEVEFAKPGKATFAAQVAEGADLGNWNVVFPEELTINVTPATIEFTEFPNGLKIAHQQSEYVANSSKHEGADYLFEHDEADAFVAVPAHIDALDLAIVPAFEPEWDGVVTDEIIEKNNLTSEALIEDYHKHYHHLAYAEPIVGAFDHKNVYFSASVAGAYKFNFTLKDEYKEYFTEGNAKSYDFEITPELVNEVLDFYEAGSYIKAAVYDSEKESWNLTEMENTGSTDHLEHVYVSTNHGGKLYYKVNYKTSDEPTLPELVKGKVAKAADALEGYTLYNASGMNLRNAQSLDMYQVVNGANTGIKHIDFVGSIPTGVAEIGAEAEGEAEYYTLEGLRVQLPLAPGAYVVRKAGRGAVIFVK